MATIRLTDRCSRPDDLPDVCMTCGRETTGRVDKKFYWMPGWVYLLILVHLLIFAIVGLCVRKTRRVSAPMCPEHRGHWFWRAWFTVGGGVAMFLGGIGMVVVLAEFQRGDLLAAWLVFFGITFLAWMTTAIIVTVNAIRATGITEHEIRLTNVSKEFVAAVRDRVDVDPEMLDQAVQRWSEARCRPPESGDDNEGHYRREGEDDQRPERYRYRE